MSNLDEKIDLKELEKKAYISIFQDGFWDILMGILLMGHGLSNFFSNYSPFFAIFGWPLFFCIGFLTSFIIKKYLTTPRIGIVKFGLKRKAGWRKVVILSLIWLSIAVVFFCLIGPNPFKNIISMAVFGLLFVIVPGSIIAYIIDFNRLYVIAVLYGLSLPLTELLHIYIGAPYYALIGYGVPGGIVLIMGLIYLIRFLRKYPLPSKEIVYDPK